MTCSGVLCSDLTEFFTFMNFIRPFLDIAVMTFILYKAYDFISKTNGVQMLKSLLIVVIAYGVAVLG